MDTHVTTDTGAGRGSRNRGPFVEAALLHIASRDQRPVAYSFQPPPGVPWRTGDYVDLTVPIHDARPLAGRLSLDVEGFELHTAETAFRDFHDEAAIASVAMAVVPALVDFGVVPVGSAPQTRTVEVQGPALARAVTVAAEGNTPARPGTGSGSRCPRAPRCGAGWRRCRSRW